MYWFKQSVTVADEFQRKDFFHTNGTRAYTFFPLDSAIVYSNIQILSIQYKTYRILLFFQLVFEVMLLFKRTSQTTDR